jgi:two-component system, NtrC family, response regulator HydG
MPSVLIVDDLLSIHEMLEAVIQPIGYTTAFATDGEKALARYKAEKYDLVLADIDMKPMDGITLLRQLKIYDPTAVVIIMTAYASTDSAVQALKFGAFEYMQKPFRVDDLIGTLKRALEYRRFSAETHGESAPVSTVLQRDIDSHLMGASAAHTKLLQQIKKLVAVRNPVLLQGEAGTGKTTIAELLHASSTLADAPFVSVDCGQSSKADFHVNLLGDQGTGGAWIKQAGGGTLFLQNLDQLQPAMQRDLVGVLRGHSQAFRVVCATTVDLEAQMEEGRFSEELFYRLATLPLHIPPLRDRPEDIPVLIKYFCAQANNPSFEAKLIEFSPDALAIVRDYGWPGNVSELAQVIGQIASSTEFRVIRADQLPLRIKTLASWPKLADYIALQEKHYIEKVVHGCRGDKARAAAMLGIEVARIG